MSKYVLAIDIDETLSATVNFMVEEIIKKFGGLSWLTVDEIVAKYQYVQNIPKRKNPNIEAFLKEMKWSNDFQKSIPVLWNAQEVVNQINKNFSIKYITARPEGVRKGTEYWLKTNKFPVAEIIMKPDEIVYQQNDQEWKANILKKLYPEVTWIIDDNSWLPDYLSPDYLWMIYLFGHKKFENKTNLNIVCCENWNTVLEKLKV